MAEDTWLATLANVAEPLSDANREKLLAQSLTQGVEKQTPMHVYGLKRVEAKQKSMTIVLRNLKSGMSVTDACENAGVAVGTYTSWRTRSPKFKAQAEAAIIEAARIFARNSTTDWMERRNDIKIIRREDFDSWVDYQVAFRMQYFNHVTFDHQLKFLDAIDRTPPGGITMILQPPMAGKTTIMLDILTADICANPNIRMALISEGRDFARASLGRIQRRLTLELGEPSLLYDHFGPFQPKANDHTRKWNSDELTVAGAKHDEQDPTLVSVGMGGNIRGKRWDRVYLDDIQSLRTLNKTRWMAEVFRGDIITRPGSDGKLLIIGSRVARGDIYEDLMGGDMVDQVVTIPAFDNSKPEGHRSYFPLQYRTDPLTSTELPVCGEDGVQLGFSDEQLEQRKRKVGPDQWARVYMQAPESDYSSMITHGDIANATDRDRVSGQTPASAVAMMAGLDPSLQAHAAFTYCAYNADHLYVVAVTDLYKATTNKRIFEEIEAGTVRYQPDYWIIESNHIQSGYLNDDTFLEMRARYGFHAIPNHTGNEKTDPSLGVPSMMNAIARGEIRFPALHDSDTAFATLFDQLISWRPDIPTRRLIQDQVMSLWFCYRAWRRMRLTIENADNGLHRDGLASITDYPYAKTNVDVSRSIVKRLGPTYQETWERLTRERTA